MRSKTRKFHTIARLMIIAMFSISEFGLFAQSSFVRELLDDTTDALSTIPCSDDQVINTAKALGLNPNVVALMATEIAAKKLQNLKRRFARVQPQKPKQPQTPKPQNQYSVQHIHVNIN